MFKKIFLFEFNSWFNKPAIYIYAIITLGLSMLFMGAASGAFDGSTSTVSSLKYVNSPNGVLQAILGLSVYLFLLFPVIIGAAIHKDFKYNVHKVMYSFPFDKKAYFWGKFLSSISISLILTMFVFIGIYAGTLMPGVNAEMIGPHHIKPYIDTFLIYIFPGIILFGAIIFAVVTYSRSVVAGFVMMIAIYVIQGVADAALQNNDYETIAAMADPFGITSNIQHTKYWTIDEQNNNAIPFSGLIIWNRLLWTGIGLLILFWSYMTFDFKVIPKGWRIFNRNKDRLTSSRYQLASIQKIDLPEVKRSYGFVQNLKSALHLTKLDLGYIVKGGPFIVISVLGLLVILITFLVSGFMFETPTLPTTKEMITRAGRTFYIFIFLLTLVYTGMIINRKRADNIYQLEDVSPTFDWSFVVSKFMSITLMQGILFLIPIIAGIIYQVYNGYYNFELNVYFIDLYAIRWVQLLPWTLMCILIYTLIPNFYIGLVTTLVLFVGIGFLDRLGIEQDVFTYNNGQSVSYSDISGYGWYLKAFYFYRLYWILGGLFFAALGWIMWRRGTASSFKDWRKRTNRNFTLRSGMVTCLFSVLFLSMGYCIYYHENVIDTFLSSKEEEIIRADFEKKFNYFETKTQPRIIGVKANVELYPEEGNLDVTGSYFLANKTNENIDTLMVMYASIKPEVSFDRKASIVLMDTTMNVILWAFDEAMASGDTIKMEWVVKNKENHFLHKYSPVVENGTFFNHGEFPSIGYQDVVELQDKKTREKYGLKDKERMPLPTDTLAIQNHILSNFSDWISFEITIGTSLDQIAMAPGNLVREWEQDGRKYFHYKMKRPMLNFYNVCSARYAVKKDKWKDVELSILYHKDHDFNLDRMMLALKDGLDYYTKEFGPYQYDQLRILEVPRVGFAQSFANTVPFSENVGFVAKPDDGKEGGVDYTYAITAHELAHQWWGHQVVSAGTQGATMVIESLSEYSSLKVLEKRYGKDKMRKFLKNALDKYLLFRSTERKKEQPLVSVENQPYIHYNKGSMVFYALSDYIGEKKLNGVLSDYIDSVAFQDPPYTTSLDLVSMIKEATPDSFLYVIEDMFENITLYDNRITEVVYNDNGDGTYTVDITAHVTKYRTDEKGKQQFYNQDSVTTTLKVKGQNRPTRSFPLADYIDVGVFGLTKDKNGDDVEKELYLQKHKITEIENKYTITVSEEPKEVGIDPYNKLIDRDSNDNRRKVDKKGKAE
ncbi:MAG: M1 family aminopeptidase [Saprospiraceae bacterium]